MLWTGGGGRRRRRVGEKSEANEVVQACDGGGWRGRCCRGGGCWRELAVDVVEDVEEEDGGVDIGRRQTVAGVEMTIAGELGRERALVDVR